MKYAAIILLTYLTITLVQEYTHEPCFCDTCCYAHESARNPNGLEY